MNSWNPFSYPPRAVLKALYAFVLPGVVAIGGAFARAQGDAKHPVDKYDYILALVAMFVTGGAVFSATNKPKAPVDEGAVGVLFIVGALLIAVAVLGLLHVISLTLTVCIVLAIIGLVCLILDRTGWYRR